MGTRSVNASQKIAELLKGDHISIQLLNAVHHLEEAQVIAQAGQIGSITIATNMAARGTDIKLGKGVVELGGLHVLATEKHESRRVDRQLFGRCGRQGDPGSAQMFVSVDDELLGRHLHSLLSNATRSLVKRGLPGATQAAFTAFFRAQNNAQKLAYKQRKSVLSMDTWMEEALSFTGVEDV